MKNCPSRPEQSRKAVHKHDEKRKQRAKIGSFFFENPKADGNGAMTPNNIRRQKYIDKKNKKSNDVPTLLSTSPT